MRNFQSWLIVAVMGVTVVSRSLWAQTPKDIPPDHWAYKMVKELLQKGYFSLYDDGTFKGDKAVDRLTLAGIVSKLLSEVGKKEIPTISKRELEDLKTLSEEFKDEIIDFKEKSAALETRLKKMEEEQKLLNDSLTRIVDETGEMMNKLASDLEDLKNVQKQDKLELQAKIESLRDDLEKQKRANRRAHSTMWIGIIVAFVAGLATN